MNFRKNLGSEILFLGFCLIFIGIFIYFFKSTKVEEIQIVSTLTPFPTPSPTATLAKVVRVIDGDTIVVDSGTHVRYIGMNTPELESNECFASEAAEINKNLVLGKTVKLVKDVSNTDKYGRLLRYVYIDSTFVDDELVKEGAAKIETVQPDVKYKDEFLQSENYARQNKLGLWGKCIN